MFARVRWEGMNGGHAFLPSYFNFSRVGCERVFVRLMQMHHKRTNRNLSTNNSHKPITRFIYENNEETGVWNINLVSNIEKFGLLWWKYLFQMFRERMSFQLLRYNKFFVQSIERLWAIHKKVEKNIGFCVTKLYKCEMLYLKGI